MDWLRHKLTLPCQRPVTDHAFARLLWTAEWLGRGHCGHLAHSQADYCWLPPRCHYPPQTLQE